MPSTSAPLDPNTTGHPVALTRDNGGSSGGASNEDVHAGSVTASTVSFNTVATDFASAHTTTTESTSTSTSTAASRGVSFASQENTVGGASQAGEKAGKSPSTDGDPGAGLFTAPDFNAAGEGAQDDVLSPTEVGPGSDVTGEQQHEA